MTLRQLLEFTAISAAQSSQLIQQQSSTTDIADYSTAIETILENWELRLSELIESRILLMPHELPEFWQSFDLLATEHSACEVVFRVFGTCLLARSRNEGNGEIEALTRQLFVRHLAVGNQLMRMALNESSSSRTGLFSVNALRRKFERWTDVLLGEIVVRHGVTTFANDCDRARDFGYDQSDKSLTGGREAVWRFIMAGLRLALPSTSDILSPQTDDYRQLAASLMTLFPITSFTTDGPFKPAFQTLIERSGNYDSTRQLQRLRLRCRK